MNVEFRQGGMSLLETMVAVIVFSIGMLGVASVMLTSMRNNDAAMLRTHSTMLATELYEMMLANLPAAEAGNYNLAMASDLPTGETIDCSTGAANCTPSQVAQWDLAQWATRAQLIMPGADAAVSVDTSVEPMIIQVDVRYDELLELSGATTETFTFRASE